MFAIIIDWFLIAGFIGAGVANILGVAGARESFVRWGYPRWWSQLTGGLEILVGVLIAIPASRLAGTSLGAAIIVAAIATVIRHREYTHLVPLGVFSLLIGLSLILSRGALA